MEVDVRDCSPSFVDKNLQILFIQSIDGSVHWSRLLLFGTQINCECCTVVRPHDKTAGQLGDVMETKTKSSVSLSIGSPCLSH